MTATQMLELLIRINRVLDAVACTWTGEAKTCVLELVRWSEAHDWNSTPDLLPLKEAIEKAADRSETWDRRCIPLSNAMAPLETRLKNAVAGFEQARHLP
jgi:hypothetical protein